MSIFNNVMGSINFLLQLERHEGVRLAAYFCSAGCLTIGAGHNCHALPVSGINKLGDQISMEDAMELFKKDVLSLEKRLLASLPFAEELCLIQPARYSVLLNMAFNLGLPGLLKFKNTLGLIESKKYTEAAGAMLQSLWAKQVGRRAKELSKQMETGTWQT